VPDRAYPTVYGGGTVSGMFSAPVTASRPVDGPA
jgi:hypothetical protein